MRKKATYTALALSVGGSALWIYGLLAQGHTSFVLWQNYAPNWVASLLPNAESEIGLAVSTFATIFVCWQEYLRR